MRVMTRLLLLCSVILSVQSIAGLRNFLPEDFFYLEEVQCNMNFWATKINLLDKEKNKIGYYQTPIWSWNRDLTFYDAQDNVLLETDIKTFLKLRTEQNIYDKQEGLIAIVEQELLNNIVNKIGASVASGLIKDETGISTKVASPYRRYSIYNPSRKLVGVSRKAELADTVIEFVDASESVVLAKATKTVSAKLASTLCINAIWEVQIFERDYQNVATDPRVIATVLANKARVDIDAAASKKWEVLNTAMSMLLTDVNKEKKDKKDERDDKGDNL